MKKSTISTLMLLLFAFGCVQTACEEESDPVVGSKNEKNTDDDSDPVTEIATEIPDVCEMNDPCECGGSTGVKCVDYSSKLLSQTGTPQPVGGITIQALCNNTGEPIANVEPVVTDDDGKFTLKGVPEGRICIFAQAKTIGSGKSATKYVDSYSWSERTYEKNPNRFQYINPEGSYDYGASMATCETFAPDDTLFQGLAGAFYKEDEDGNYDPVGCAEIRIKETENYKQVYANEGSTLDPSEPNTNPQNATYVSCELHEDTHYTVQAYVGDTILGQDCPPFSFIKGEKVTHFLYFYTTAKLPPEACN